MSGVKRLAVEAGWTILGQLLAFSGALILVRLLTDYMAPDQYGQLALGLTVAGLLSQVISGGIGGSVGRFYSIASEQQDLDSYFFAIRKLIYYSSVASGLVGLTIAVCLYLNNEMQLFILMSAVTVFAILSSCNGILNNVISSARERKIIALNSSLDAWLRICFSLIFLNYINKEGVIVLFAYICSALFVLMSQMWTFHRYENKIDKNRDKNKFWLRKIYSYSVPITSWTMFSWLQQVSDRWFLQVFASIEDVGKYAVLIQVAYTPIILVASAGISFITPIIYQYAGDASDSTRIAHNHRLCWKITYAGLIVTIVLFLTSFLFCDWYFSIVVGTKYREISYLMPWVMLSAGLFSAGQILTQKLVGDMKLSSMTKGKIISSIIGVMLNLIGAKLAGIEGVVCASVIYSAIYLMWIGALARAQSIPTSSA